jgi:hypothetical protein
VTASHTYAAGTYTVTLTVTDDDDATDSTSKEVAVTAPSEDGGGSDDPVLSGSSTSQGSTWTAIVTLTGAEGDQTTGTWDDGTSGTCMIDPNRTSCSFSLSRIRKNVGSVTYTDSSLGSVTITKP